MASELDTTTAEEGFKKACDSVWEHRYSKEFQASKMQLYGLYKASTVGKCQESKPPMVMGTEDARAKWEAWMQASTFEREDAMTRYTKLALEVVKARAEAEVGAGGDTKGGRTPQEYEIERLNERTRELEGYLSRIHEEMSHIPQGPSAISMSGWLSKWRDRDVYLWGAPKWEPLFFELRGATLSAYRSEHGATQPESVVGLRRCVLRDEGTKMGKAPGKHEPPVYHIFSIYLEGASKRGPDAGVLLRLSTGDGPYARSWIDVISNACNLEGESDSSISGTDESEGDVGSNFPPSTSPLDSDRIGLSGSGCVESTVNETPSKAIRRTGSWDVAGLGPLHSAGVAATAGGAGVAGGEVKAGGLESREQASSTASLQRLTLQRLNSIVKLSEQDVHEKVPQKKKFDPTGYPASRPTHKQVQPSLLSESSPDQNYRGLLNLGAILMLVTNFRLIAANLRVYGLLVGTPSLSLVSSLLMADTERLVDFFFHEWPCLTGTLSLVLHVAAAFSIECAAAPRPGREGGLIAGGEPAVILLHGINISIELGVAVSIVWRSLGSPLFGMAYLFTAVVLWMKLISYAHANRDLRLDWRVKAEAAKAKDSRGKKEPLAKTPATVLGGGNADAGEGAVGGGIVQAGMGGSSDISSSGAETGRRKNEVANEVTLSAAPSKSSSTALPPAAELSSGVRGGSCSRGEPSGPGGLDSGREVSYKVRSSFHQEHHHHHHHRHSHSHSHDHGHSGTSHGHSGTSTYHSIHSYPGNLYLKNILYFWFAPTLCYQLKYPRSEKVRLRYMASLVLRMVLLGGAMSVIIDQYVLPAVHGFLALPPSTGWIMSLERLLALSVPNTYMWLLGFYVFFHLILNLLAEALRFGDRIFYRDWWNANTIESYWRLWNLPVHYWMVRHLYFPALRLGLSKNTASMLCFLFSAVMHELLVSVPFHMIKFYAFFGMVGNIPLVPLTKALNNILGRDQQTGNWIFWVLFCIVGQPMSLLLYYRDYCKEHACENPFLE